MCLTECLLRKLVLTLTKAVQAGQATEEMKSQAEELTNSETPERDISLIKHKNKNRCGAHFQQNHQNVDKYDEQYSKFYASSHLRRWCPAYNKQCTKCNSKGNCASCCHSQKSVWQIEIYTDSSDSDLNPEQLKFFLGMIKVKDPYHVAQFSNESHTSSFNSLISDKKAKPWTVNLNTNGSMVNFKIKSDKCNSQKNIQQTSLVSKTEIKLSHSQYLQRH